jgi:uncharacterized protein YqgV (UPF0045/DUF77 family)
MAFFAEYVVDPNPPSNFDETCAQKLRDALTNRRIGNSRKVSKKKWANEFKKLRKFHDEDTIRDTLDWFCSNLRRKYVPVAHSAVAFRRKFEGIRDAQERNKKLAISSQAKEVADRLSKDFPIGLDHVLPMVVQIGMNNLKEIMPRIKALQRRAFAGEFDHTTEQIVTYFTGYFRSKKCQWVIYDYMVELIQILKSWPGFDGNLKPLAFNIEGRLFERIMQKAAVRRFNDAGAWESYAKHLATTEV